MLHRDIIHTMNTTAKHAMDTMYLDQSGLYCRTLIS